MKLRMSSLLLCRHHERHDDLQNLRDDRGFDQCALICRVWKLTGFQPLAHVQPNRVKSSHQDIGGKKYPPPRPGNRGFVCVDPMRGSGIVDLVPARDQEGEYF